jgi:predicted amidophosphoribosyltransferase
MFDQAPIVGLIFWACVIWAIVSYRKRKKAEKLRDAKKCPQCGAALLDLAKFCHNCSSRVQLEAAVLQPRKPISSQVTQPCHMCGSSMPAEDRFCGNCGEDLKARTVES